MDKKEFQEKVRQACRKESSADPTGWSEDNPTWGHCAVVALLAQDYFGGEILRASLEGTQFADAHSHYRNEVDDFTEEQFGSKPLNLIYEPRMRNYLLANTDTHSRYQLLKASFEELLIQ